MSRETCEAAMLIVVLLSLTGGREFATPCGRDVAVPRDAKRDNDFFRTSGPACGELECELPPFR